MNPRLPSTTARQIIRALEKAGFVLHHQKGSHAAFLHPDGRRTIVTIHPGDMPRGLVRRIIRDTGMGVDEFIRLLWRSVPTED